MLVLTRNQGESIIIGQGEIVITVLSNSGKQIKIGVTAPKNISVHRKEIYERIQEQSLKQKSDESTS